MDDIVMQAMAKWPKVPYCYGWLGLDARGRWYLRDEQAQAAGAFIEGAEAGKGSLLEHEKFIAFIGRNYAADDAGWWYFQNGPQRVYVELAATPFIWRLVSGEPGVRSHTGLATQVEQCIVDEQGRVYLHTPLGFGLVHTQDVPLAADAIEAGRWTPQEMASDTLASRFGFVRSPQAAQALQRA